MEFMEEYWTRHVNLAIINLEMYSVWVEMKVDQRWNSKAL